MNKREMYRQAYRLARIEYRLMSALQTHLICGGSRHSIIGQALVNEKRNAHMQLFQLQMQDYRLFNVYAHHHHYVKPFPRNLLGHVMKDSQNPVHPDVKSAVYS